MEISEAVQKQQLIALYRKLHQIPQIGLQQHQTTSLIVSHVVQIQGAQILKQQIQTELKTGVIVRISANENKDQTKKGYLFRCDIDALKFKEESGLDYSSQNGLHHACGHDAHTTMLLTAVKTIALRRKQLRRDIYFCFQPGEEGHGGASKLLEKFPNLLENVEKCFALHAGNFKLSGVLVIPQEYATSNSSKFRIEITGKSAHCMLQHLAIDANYIGCQVVTEIYSLKTRLVHPFNTFTIAVIRIEGGSQHSSVIADRMTIVGVVRSFVREEHQKIEQHIREYAQAICRINGAKCSFTELSSNRYRAVKNDPSAISIVRSAASSLFDKIQSSKPSLAGEDFCEFSQRKASCYFILGVGLAGTIDQESKESKFPIHSNKFKIDENALIYGVKMWQNIAFNDLKNNG